MKKAQRKAEARAQKRRAREAKKARKDTKPEDKPADSDAHAPAPEITPSMTQAELAADPELMEAALASQHRDEESFELQDVAIQAETELNLAKDIARNARALDDERAREMLVDAAELCHDIVGMVRETLRGVSNERLAAAREILNAKPQTGTDGRKLPRRAPDPLVTLERIGLQAASLLKRILAKTNPAVGKRGLSPQGTVPVVAHG